MASDPRQQRRRVDRDNSSRLPAERVLIGLGVAVALAGVIFGGWWVYTETGIGVLVRDSSPGWTTNGEVMYSCSSGGKADICVADRSGSERHGLVATPGDDGGPAFSPDGSQIAYHSDKEGNYDIYVAQADGLAPIPVTRDPAVDQYPAWSRDGAHIVFMSNRGGKDFNIYRMKSNGTDVEKLTSSGSNWFPEYSPDGGQLALHIGQDVFIMSVATKGLRQITFGNGGMHPTWAPDGRQMAFASSRHGRSEIFLSLVDGANPQSIVTMPTGDAIDPRWSPDGKYIAFVHVPGGVGKDQDGTGQRIVYIVEVGSGRLQRISR